MNKVSKNRQGFIALITMIIISVLFENIVFSSGFTSLLSQQNILLTYQKEESFYNARSCLSYAVLKIFRDSSYYGNENITISSDVCFVLSIIVTGKIAIISTRAVVDTVSTKLESKVDLEKHSFTYKEVPN
jgi:hypothetical protein